MHVSRCSFRIFALTTLIAGTSVLQPTGAFAQADAEKRGGGGNGGGGNNRPGSLTFHQQHFPIREDRGPVRISVKRNGGTAGAISVHYEAKAGSGPGAATAADFAPTAGVLEWADGDRANKSFEVEIVDDSESERIETFQLVLSAPTGGASIDRHNALARVQILDDDQGSGDDDDDAGILRFAETETAVVESAGTARIVVERQGGSDGAVTVHFETGGGSATPGADYTAANGTLSWADGDSADKVFDVAILDDSIDERRESVRLRLSAPTGGARVHPTKGSAELALIDDDGAGGTASGVIRFERRDVEVREGRGEVVVVVERRRGSEGAVSVAFAVRGGSAQSPDDFTLVEGVLEWADGDSADKTFVVTIVDDSLDERKERIVLELESLTDGVEIDRGHGVMAIEIADND